VITIRVNSIEVKRALDRLSHLRIRQLGEVVGAFLESKARERVGETKKDPEGVPWVPWSPTYALARAGGGKGKKSGGGLLERTGALLDSLAFEVEGNRVIVGSPLVYSAAHQEGTDKIPARPYLGLATADADELAEVIGDWIEGQVAA
jgi:phage gpG-like protein